MLRGYSSVELECLCGAVCPHDQRNHALCYFASRTLSASIAILAEESSQPRAKGGVLTGPLELFFLLLKLLFAFVFSLLPLVIAVGPVANQEQDKAAICR